jgi:hypothetical protein
MSMRYGNRTEAAEFGDPDAMLARFEPAPGRVARLVLHPRLSFVPCDADAFDAFRQTFAVDIAARIFTTEDVIQARANGTDSEARAAEFDEAIESIIGARDQYEAATRRRREVEPRLEEARVALDRVYAKRAEAADAIAIARERLQHLEGATTTAAEAHAELNAARAELEAAEHEAEAAASRASGDTPDIKRARAELEAADAELRRISERPHDASYALDDASHQLELWAAQRAADTARYDLERLLKLTVDADAASEAAATQQRVAAARARVDAATSAVEAAARVELPDDPDAEAAALRAQIEAVERSLDEAEAAREAEVNTLEQEAESAERDAEAADRQLEWARERIELEGQDLDIDGALAELRARREALTDDDGLSPVGRLLRDLALDAPEPLLVFVAPVAEADEDLIGALISVSGLKRTVVVTDKTEMLREARELDPALGAVREPLETGGPQRQELARSDGNRT